MGHKVHPTGFRLGVIKGWQSRWYADDKNYKVLLAEDNTIRKLINKELSNASVARIEIERVAGTQISITIHTAKPGIVIGKSGEKVDRLRDTLQKLTNKKVHPKVQEIRTPEMEAILVAKSIAEQLERRISFRRAMKQAVQKTMKAGAKGIRVICAGRLGGAEIARSEREVEGSVPLHTLRADIDFAIAEAHTTFGTIGIKVWIYKGLVLSGPRQSTTPLFGEAGERPPRPERPRADRDRGGDRRGPRSGGDRDRGGSGGFRGGNAGGDRGGPRGGGGSVGGDRGPRPPFAPRPEGARPPFTPRPEGARPPFTPRPEGAARPPFTPRPEGDRGARPEGTNAEAPRAPIAPRPPEQSNSTPAPAPEQKPEA